MALPNVNWQINKLAVNTGNISSGMDKLPERVETAITHKLEEYGRRSFGILQELGESSLHNNTELERIVSYSLN